MWRQRQDERQTFRRSHLPFRDEAGVFGVGTVERWRRQDRHALSSAFCREIALEALAECGPEPIQFGVENGDVAARGCRRHVCLDLPPPSVLEFYRHSTFMGSAIHGSRTVE